MNTHDPTKETLKNILNQHGTAICSEPKRLRAMLHDMTTESKGKVKALIAVIEEGVAGELIQYPNKQVDEHFYRRMIRWLHENAAIDENIAEWAITCWVEALNKSAPPRTQETALGGSGITSTTAPLPPIVQQPLTQPSQVIVSTSTSPQGNAPTTAEPVQPRKKRSFFFRLAVICFLLFGAYKLFLTDNESTRVSTETSVAGEKTEETDDNIEPTSVQNDTASQQDETEADSDLTSSITEQEVREFIKRYIILGVEAINQRDFSLVEDLIDPNGSLYDGSQNYLQHMEEENITEQLTNLDVQQVETVDKNHFKVYTYEEYKINYNDEFEKFKSFNSEYLVIVLPNHTLKVRELMNTKQMDSYDTTEENSTDIAIDDETSAVENTIMLHYTSISNDDFTTAYDLFSSNRKKRVTMEGWVKGLQHNIRNEIDKIEVTAIEDESATAYIELTSYDDNEDGTVLVQQWGGYWYLKKENGRWVLDKADIQKLDSRVENNEAF